MKMGYTKHKRGLLYAAIFIVFFVYALLTLDPDFGWHLTAGQYFLRHGIPATDIFTYTAPAFPWINHEWLSDIIVAGLYGIGSYWIVAAGYAALWTTGIWLVGKRVHPALVVTASAALLPFAGARTVALSVVGVALLIMLLQQKNQQWRLLLPLVFLIWANMHGSFLLGIALVAYCAYRERSRELVMLGLISLVCTFVNPYGASLYTEIFRTMTDASLRQTIFEWQAVAFPIASVPYLLIWIAFLVVRNKTNWRRYLRFDVALFIASIMSLRMTPLFVIVSLPGLARLVHDAVSVTTTVDKRLVRRAIAVLISVTVVLALASAVLDVVSSRDRYPRRAVEYLQTHPCEGNVFNQYDFGGFLIWQLPEKKVYIDGRMPSWEQGGHKYMQDYLNMYRDQAFRRAQFIHYNVRCVVDKTSSSLVKELKSEQWRVVSDDGHSVLLLAPR